MINGEKGYGFICIDTSYIIFFNYTVIHVW